MKWSSICGGMMIGALCVMQSRAQDVAADLTPPTARAAAGYHAPLAGAMRYSVAPRLAPTADKATTTLPPIPVSATPLQRAADTALDVGGKAAVMWAAQKHGTHASVPPPGYTPCRPTMPMPEPCAEPVNCQPDGSLVAPAMCPAR